MSHRYRIPLVGALIALIAGLASAPANAAGPSAAATLTAVGVSTADCAKLRHATTTTTTIAAATKVRSIDCVRPAAAKSPNAAVSAIGCGANSFAFERSRSCQKEERRVSLVSLPDLVELGWIDYDVVSIVLLSGRQTAWSHAIAFEALRAGGNPAILNTTISAVPLCGSGCVGPAGSTFPQGARFNTVTGQVAGAAAFGVLGLGANSLVFSSSQWSWTFSNPAAAMPSPPTRIVSAEHRCDSKLPGESDGCAYTLVTPQLVIPTAKYPKYATHIRLALGSGLPSRLTRTTTDSVIDRNRATACPASIPRGGASCDEYPFASTFEGAASQPYGRQFLIVDLNGSFFFGCGIPFNLVPKRLPGDSGGYSVCLIPGSENSLGGSDLRLFYLDNRVIEFDTFDVIVR
jgi:hypothetical protein